MKINYQEFYTTLQDKLIELYDKDPTKAKIIKEFIDETKDELKPKVGWCDDY